MVQEVPEEDSSSEEEDDEEEQSPDRESSPEQLHEDTKDLKDLGHIISQSPYASIEMPSRLQEFDIHKEHHQRSSTLMGETSMEQIRPLTPPKQLFYDSTYNVESDPEFKRKLTKRHLKSIEMMHSREKSIASSEDERGREPLSRLSDMEQTDRDRWNRKDLTSNKKNLIYYDSAGSTQYASGFEKTTTKFR